MDILIIKLGALGDVINTLPLAITLKKHLHARIHWVVEPLSFPIIAAHSSVASAVLFDKYAWRDSLSGVLHEIRKQRFDICLDMQRILKSGILCLASHSVQRIGFDRARCKEMTWLFPFERIPQSDPSRHMVYQYLEFADYLGASSGEISWDIPVGSSPFDLPGRYLVLNIGATKEANRWTPGGFSSLADKVWERYRIPSVLTGAAQDITMAEEIMARADAGNVINLVGKTSLKDLISILHGSAALVSCDTGPMHLGVALGKEVVALFGPADPRRTGPFRGHVIRKPLECSPCNRRTCKDPVCMRSIDSDDVLEKIELVFDKISGR